MLDTIIVGLFFVYCIVAVAVTRAACGADGGAFINSERARGWRSAARHGSSRGPIRARFYKLL